MVPFTCTHPRNYEVPIAGMERRIPEGTIPTYGHVFVSIAFDALIKPRWRPLLVSTPSKLGAQVACVVGLDPSLRLPLAPGAVDSCPKERTWASTHAMRALRHVHVASASKRGSRAILGVGKRRERTFGRCKKMSRGRTSPRGDGRTVGAPSAAGRGSGFRDAVADVDYDPMEFGDGEVEGNLLLDSVVKLYCVHTEPNYSLPWQRKRQFTSTSSAFAIAGRRILTNAHSVEYNTQVKVKKRGDDTRFLAKVLAISVECDIALLTVTDDRFWEDLQPLDFGPLPHLQDQVAVVGYPIGGDTISITSGIVSRVEVTSYTHGASELLAIQIDAAINSGNSGGPVFNSSGQCCGIAFQSLVGDDAENIGYVIPPPVIQHFLEDFKRNGLIAGFPVLGIQWQRLESPSLRSSLAMEAQTTGVLVAKTAPVSDAHSKLKRGDVIMSFEGVKVSNNGTVPFRSGERINFSYLVSQHYVGDVVRLSVLRQKEEVEVEVSLSTPFLLVPVHIGGKMPPYLIVAGLVFTPLCEPYLRSEYGEHYYTDSPVKLLDAMLHQFPKDASEEVVILSQVLACDATVGYEEVRNTRLLRVNGEKVHNLRHLADLVDKVKDEPFLRLESEYDEVIVLEMSKVVHATAETLETHAIPADRSPDLLCSD